MKLLDKIPLPFIAVFAIFLTVAPIFPMPHLLEKIQMLYAGTLVKPLDIFDLFWHSFGLILLALKLIRLNQLQKSSW